MDPNKTKSASEGIAPMGLTTLNETILSNQPESRYECPVCLNWLRDPVITTCGHKFCKSCITSWLRNSGHCPIDNINLSMKVDIFPDNYTKREIQEQRMSCPFADKGCNIKVTPLDLDAHIANCEYNQPEASSQSQIRVPCSFQAVGCKETFESQEEMNNHLHKDIQNHMSFLMNAYSEIKINNDISNASIDAKEQEAMNLWEAPDKDGAQSTSGPLTNTSALIRMSNQNRNPREIGRAHQFQRGQPTSVVQRGTRSQRRAYEFQQRQNFETDWNNVREFEERPRLSRGPTNRSQAWKSKKENKPAKEDAATAFDFRAKEETAPVDEPLYDLGPHSSAIPVQEIYSQNFEFAGYVDQVERTYEILCGIDPRLDRRLPFSMFQHSMTTILNCCLMDLTLENGEMSMGPTRCQDLLPEDLCIPDNLYHFLASVGNTATVGGEEIRFNLPEVAIPQAADGDVPAGSFGQVTPESHNVYECYVSPLVTSNRVLNSRRAHGEPEIPPLPAVLVPAGAIPTANLLGHGPPDVLPFEARHRIEGFDFPEGDSISAKLKICPELMSRVNTVLFKLRDRFKMRDIGRSSPELRNYIAPKTLSGNVQFVRVVEAVPDIQRLSKRQNQIRGPASFGSATAGYNNVTCLHRERTHNASGACFIINGAIPQGWQAHINANFNMTGPFTPTIGANNPVLRVTKFISHSPGGSRVTAIDHYIKRNYYIPAK